MSATAETHAPIPLPIGLMTIEEVAELSRRTPRTLRNRRYAQLDPQPCSKRGERILYRRSDVLAWLLADEKSSQ